MFYKCFSSLFVSEEPIMRMGLSRVRKGTPGSLPLGSGDYIFEDSGDYILGYFKNTWDKTIETMKPLINKFD